VEVTAIKLGIRSRIKQRIHPEAKRHVRPLVGLPCLSKLNVSSYGLTLLCVVCVLKEEVC
jgi:hypothetical protein